MIPQARLANSLAFRGDTALHKLYLQPQPRYSEDIDLVQVRAEPIKEIVQRLQVEANTREHFTVYGLQQFPFEVKSSWFDGGCNLTTYRLEELLGTKLRALYQRKKGRDLYDMFIALTQKPDLDIDALLHCYREYMTFSVEKPPTQREYILNMEAKMQDSEFLGDTTALLRPDVPYNPQTAYELVKTTLIERI